MLVSQDDELDGLTFDGIICDHFILVLSDTESLLHYTQRHNIHLKGVFNFSILRDVKKHDVRNWRMEAE